jgi:hypothetical protein
MHHLVDETDDDAATVVDTTDWAGRNWAIHKLFVGQMDALYGAANINGANIFLLGDDFYQPSTHRDSLTDVLIDQKLMSLVTTTNAAGQIGTVVYKTITNTVWNSGATQFVPRKLRVQSVHNIPSNGSYIKFNFNYTTTQGPQATITIMAADLNNQWVELDWETHGDIIDFTLSAELRNPNIAGDQPVLGQFILILKD